MLLQRYTVGRFRVELIAQLVQLGILLYCQIDTGILLRENNMKNKFRYQTAINVFLVLAVLFAFYIMYFKSDGLLQARGIAAFKYFTVLSNVFGGVMAAVWLIFSVFTRKKGKEMPRTVVLFKYTAAVCLGLTFVTVMVFLGPLYGYIAMLRKANLWFHLLIPLTAMAEFVFLNSEEIGVRNCAASMLPMLTYATFYLIYNLIMGQSENPFRYDWYGFLLWGWGVGVCIFAVICCVTFGIGAVLRLLNKNVGKKHTEK